jgi:hypothetical protein
MNAQKGRTRDPREIEAELDRTRAEMGYTLDKLQHKFSPGELFDQGLNYVRANSGGEFASNLKQAMTRNPLPVALIGLSFVWLMMSGRRGSAAAYAPADETDAEDALSRADTAIKAGVSRGTSSPSDEMTRGLDAGSATSNQTGFKVYGGGKSTTSGPSDEVARGLDEGSSSSGKTAHTQGGRSHVSGPSDEIAKALDEASTRSSPTSAPRNQNARNTSTQESPR